MLPTPRQALKRLLIPAACVLLAACHSLSSGPEPWQGSYAQAERAYAQGDYARSAGLADRAVLQAIEQEGDGSLAYARAASLAGAAHLAQARYKEAETRFEQALPIILSSPDASVADRSAAYNNLAEIYREQERHDLALPLLQRALALTESVYDRESREVAEAAAALALAHHSGDELDRAEPPVPTRTGDPRQGRHREPVSRWAARQHGGPPVEAGPS